MKRRVAEKIIDKFIVENPQFMDQREFLIGSLMVAKVPTAPVRVEYRETVDDLP